MISEFALSIEAILNAAHETGAEHTFKKDGLILDWGMGCVIDVTINANFSVTVDGAAHSGIEEFETVQEFIEYIR